MPDSAPPPWQTAGHRHIWMPYTQMQTAPAPTPVVGTGGVCLHLADGRTLIDGLASWWTACHGYNHPVIRERVAAQLAAMPHVMFGGIQHEPALRLAERLSSLLPGDLNRVFFSDSGSVAVEVAMKMAAQYWRNLGVANRNRFVTFQHAYHGDTTGAMSLCDPVNSMHQHFKGFLLEQYPRPIPRSEDDAAAFARFLAERHSELAGVFIEPLVQGAGGMKFHDPESLMILGAACDRHGLLLIADELATGFGRTGTMFAIEQAAIVPDIVCLGKALTAGTLGMAATVATDRVFEAFLSDDPAAALMHGPTFMANPLACAAANASLDLFVSEPRLEQVRTIESQLAEELAPCAEMPGVREVRVRGAIGVIEVEDLKDADRLRSEFVQRGVWLRPFGNMIYTTPPLTITPEELATVCAAIREVTRAWTRW